LILDPPSEFTSLARSVSSFLFGKGLVFNHFGDSSLTFAILRGRGTLFACDRIKSDKIKNITNNSLENGEFRLPPQINNTTHCHDKLAIKNNGVELGIRLINDVPVGTSQHPHVNKPLGYIHITNLHSYLLTTCSC
jgi:hypothetical protein